MCLSVLQLVTNKKETRRVAICVPNLNEGGAERSAIALANGLVDRGFYVDLVVFSFSGALIDSLDRRVRAVDLKSTRVLNGIPSFFSYLTRQKPDVVVSFLVNFYISVLKLFFGDIIKCFVSEHSTLSVQVRNQRSLVRKAFMVLSAFLYPLCDGVIAVSRGVAGDLVSKFFVPRDKIHVVYNPACRPDAVPLSLGGPNHPWFHDDIPVLVSMGRLVWEKDYPTLLKAVKRVSSSKRVRLIILGDGPLRVDLERLVSRLCISQDVFFAGRVDNPFPYLAAADLYVSSSKCEGLGNALIEALSVGTPVLSTDCPHGPAEILGFGKFGSLVPVGDDVIMAQEIESLLSHKRWTRDYLMKRAQRFSVGKIVDSYEGILLDSLS